MLSLMFRNVEEAQKDTSIQPMNYSRAWCLRVQPCSSEHLCTIYRL